MQRIKQKLSYLILGQKGGQNRIQIIELLKERPYNLNQLAEILNLNYRTIKHHVDVLLKNELVSTSRTGGYGEVYFLTPDMEGNMEIFDDIIKKFEKSKILKDFTSSLKFFKKVMEQTNDAVIIINKDGKTFFWNESAEKLYGYKKKEILDETIQIFPDLEIQEDLIRKLANGEHIVAFETNLSHKSGKLINASLTMDGIKDENDNLIGFSILSRDITKRKRAEEALKLSEERYALAQRVANIGSWDWNIETGDLHWSGQIEPMFGFSGGEFGATYEAFLECVHPEDRQYVIDSINACVEDGKDYDIEHRIVWPDGTTRTVSETGDVFRDENGKAIRMLGIVRDITEHKKAEEEFRKLSRAVEQSPVSVIITDPKGDIEYVNPKFTQLTGYTFDEVKGQNPRILKSGEQTQEFYKELWDTITSGKEWRGEFHNKKKNGESYWELASISPIKNEKDEITHFLAVKEDITERKQVEEALRESEELHRITLSSISDTVLITDDNGEFVFICPNIDVIFGYTQHEVQSFGNISKLIGDNLFDIKELKKLKEIKNIEFEVEDKGGTKHDLLINLKNVMIKGGTVLYSCRDITERKQIVKVLKENEEKYRLAFNMSPDIFYLVDPEGKIIDCNDAVIKTLGYSRDELVGMPLLNIYAEESKPKAKEYFQEWLKTGKLRDKLLKIVAKDGTKIDIELNVNTIYDSDGKVVSSISSQRDITERKR